MVAPWSFPENCGTNREDLIDPTEAELDISRKMDHLIDKIMYRDDVEDWYFKLRDEFMAKGIVITKDNIIDLYKMAIYASHYSYDHRGDPIISIEQCHQLAEQAEEIVRTFFTEKTVVQILTLSDIKDNCAGSMSCK